MAQATFEKLPGDHSLAETIRVLRVPLQAELLRAGATWEESLAVLREMVSHSRAFPSAADALAWYRAPYHPAV
ncbi:MAG: hypothetical protein Kow0092_18980 [Deferrisomatales bacterium]